MDETNLPEGRQSVGGAIMLRQPASVLLGVSLLSLVSVAAWAAPPQNYPIRGTVLEAQTSVAFEHMYKVETESSIYELSCYRQVLWGRMGAKCSVNGKPLAPGDEVHLRADGETMLFDSGNHKEQKLWVALEEAKNLPALPQGAGAVVLAYGYDLTTDGASYTPSAPPAPATPTSSPTTVPSGPVTVISATGGAPVLVTPTAPATGQIVTGVSTTGNVVTGVAVTPIGTPEPAAPLATGSPSSTPGPQLVKVFYLQTEDRIYKIACFIRCSVDGSKLSLGDLFDVRIAKSWVYISRASGNSGNGARKESCFRILSVSDVDQPPSAMPL